MATEPAGQCWRCLQPATLLCPRCNFAEYCGPHCAEADRAEHEEECSESATAELPCGYCGRLSRHLSRCRHCHLVAYCSTSCCQLDTRLHMPTCLAGRDAILRVANSLTHGAEEFRLPEYFGGGLHALNLLKGVSGGGEQPLHLLQLSGQLHHLLRTCASAAGSRRVLAATLAADSAHQLSRACLLLHLLGGAGPRAAVQVMYSLQLQPPVAQQLHAALEQLVGATYSQLLQLLPWLQVGRATLSHWQEVWRAWLSALQDAGCLERMLACRAAAQESRQAELQRYLAALPARQQRPARRLLTQHGCLLSGDGARAASVANVTLLALNPRRAAAAADGGPQQWRDLRLGAAPPGWLAAAAGDAATVLVPARTPGPLADWDAAEVERALGPDCDPIDGCRQLAEDCATALQLRIAAGRCKIRFVLFDTLEQLDDELAGLKFDRIFTADATDRLGVFPVLEMSEILLADTPDALIITSHRRWAALSPPKGTTVSALRGGGTLAWDHQLYTDQFRLIAYLQAARLAYLAAARDKDVLDPRLSVPTTPEVSIFGTLLLTDPTRRLLTVAPHRFRRAPRLASSIDPDLRMLEWRRDPEGVRRQLIENRAQIAAEQPVPASADSPQTSVQHRGPGQYERQLRERPVSEQPPPEPVYGSIRRRAGSLPARRRVPRSAEPASPAQYMAPYSLYENLATLRPAGRAGSVRSPRPPPTPVARASSMSVGTSWKHRERVTRMVADDPMYETVAAVRYAKTLPSPPSTPLNPDLRRRTLDIQNPSDITYFRRTASLRAMRQQPSRSFQQIPETPTLVKTTSPLQRSAPAASAAALQTPSLINTPRLNGDRRAPSAALPSPARDPAATPTSASDAAVVPKSMRIKTPGLDMLDRPSTPSPNPYNSTALQTPEGRRRLVQAFVFPPIRAQHSEKLYDALPRRTLSLHVPKQTTGSEQRAVRDAGHDSPGWQNQSSPSHSNTSSSGFYRSPELRPLVGSQTPRRLDEPSKSATATILIAAKVTHNGPDTNYDETTTANALAVKSPEDIDHMTQRRRPKNIADWLREDRESQREFEQQRVAGQSNGTQWYKQEKPAAQTSESSASLFSAASASTPPTRPGRIRPVLPVSDSSKPTKKRTSGNRTSSATQRLLAELEHDWSLNLSDQQASENSEHEPQTIAELGARDEVAHWLVERLLKDQLRDVSVEYLDQQVTEALRKMRTTEQNMEDTATTHSQQRVNRTPFEQGHLAPDLAQVDTPDPRRRISGPFDINAQEVGKLESPRFQLDTPAPKSLNREEFFAEMKQYISPVTRHQLVTNETANIHRQTRNNEQLPKYSASVLISPPEQRIVVPIPSEALQIQPPAIQVPDAINASQTGEHNKDVVPLMPQSSVLLSDHTNKAQPIPMPRSSSVSDKEVRGLASPSKSDAYKERIGTSTPDQRIGQKDIPVTSKVSDTAADPHPRTVTDAVKVDLSTSKDETRVASGEGNCTIETSPNVKPVDDRFQDRSSRRKRLIDRASGHSDVLSLQRGMNMSSHAESESPNPRNSNAFNNDPHSCPEVTAVKVESKSVQNNVPAPAANFKTSADISPEQAFSKQTMMWKIPLVEKQTDVKDSDSRLQLERANPGEPRQTDPVAPDNALNTTRTPAAQQSPRRPVRSRRNSKRLSMDKEFYEMKQKLSEKTPQKSAESRMKRSAPTAGPVRRSSTPPSIDVEFNALKQNQNKESSPKDANSTVLEQSTLQKPSTPVQRMVSIEDELVFRASHLHAVPVVEQPRAASPPRQLIRTGSVRQRAALFSQSPGAGGGGGRSRPPPSQPETVQRFTRLQSPEGAPVRSEITVRLSRSPSNGSPVSPGTGTGSGANKREQSPAAEKDIASGGPTPCFTASL